MVDIVHYEVYSQRNNSWRLEERFPSDQRDMAFDLAKRLEQKQNSVKVVRESFDVNNNRYTENVEYINNVTAKQQNKLKAKAEAHKAAARQIKLAPQNKKESAINNGGKITLAVIIIVCIILFCLFFTNILVTLLSPLIEEFLPPEYRERALSILFFTLFLSTATPLVITKVPWHVFDTNYQRGKVNDKRIYSSVDSITKRYRLNDDVDPSTAPVNPDTPVFYRNYIVDFLSKVVSIIDDSDKIKNSYSKLGIKFIIFGGCLEIARVSNLSFSEANSVLYEAFKIIDGDNTSLEEFYEAKRAYSGNKLAVYMTGVGAYLASKMMKNQPSDPDLMKNSYEKWLNQEQKPEDASAKQASIAKKATVLRQQIECTANIQYTLKLTDEFDEAGADILPQISVKLREIIQKSQNLYNGTDVSLLKHITSVKFNSLGSALSFVMAVLKDFSNYLDNINDDNIDIKIKSSILNYAHLLQNNAVDFMNDIFDLTYTEEVMVEKDLTDKLKTVDYEFESLGEKHLPKSNTTVSLYKLLY